MIAKLALKIIKRLTVYTLHTINKTWGKKEKIFKNFVWRTGSESDTYSSLCFLTLKPILSLSIGNKNNDSSNSTNSSTKWVISV